MISIRDIDKGKAFEFKETDMKRNTKFDEILSKLPVDFKNEINEADKFLKSLRSLRFKRIIDKHGGKISYVASDYGFSYAFRVIPSEYSQEFNWYIVYNGKPETWHRRADYMEETLDEISKNKTKLSEYIFNSLIKCNNCHGERCLARTIYAFNGQKKLTCHGRVTLEIKNSDFECAREFIQHLSVLVERKIINGDPPPEKIILINTKRSL